MSKRGMEMSVGIIVIIILSVMIFSVSLYLIFKWFGAAEELKAEIDKQTKEQILTALKTGNQLVAVPIPVQETKRGNAVNYGIGIRNIAAERKFGMALSFSGAYTPDGKDIQVDERFMNEKWLGAFSVIDVGPVRKNEQKVVPFLIKADVNVGPSMSAPKGDYVFNLCVYDAPLTSAGEPPAPCTIGQFRTSSEAFYTGKIYQVTVKLV